MEEKLIEEEVARRVEELVAKRVEEELEKRKDEIEAEVKRRVEEAKKIMEKQMLQELEQQREAEIEAQKRKEVMGSLARQGSYNNNLAISRLTNGLAAYFCFPRALQIRPFNTKYLFVLSVSVQNPFWEDFIVFMDKIIDR